jgi:acetyltransferase-like isoleucine patch superfamily enzyme
MDKDLLKKCGENVQIDDTVKIINPEMVEIGSNVRIDYCTCIIGGNGVKIGDYCHVAKFVDILGGGGLTMGDFTAIGSHSTIITGSDHFFGEGLVGPTIPLKYRNNPIKKRVTLEDYAIIGTNNVAHPGVTLHEGAITGSMTLINKDLEPWTVYIGIPARIYRPRKKELLISYGNELRRYNK